MKRHLGFRLKGHAGLFTEYNAALNNKTISRTITTLNPYSSQSTLVFLDQFGP